MSAREDARKDDPKEPQQPAPSDAAPHAATPDAAKPGLKYVFKIQPADPKRNSIDFEDVADK